MKELDFIETQEVSGGNIYTSIGKIAQGCFNGGTGGNSVAVKGNEVCAAMIGCVAGASTALAGGTAEAQQVSGMVAGASSNGAYRQSGCGTGSSGFGAGTSGGSGAGGLGSAGDGVVPGDATAGC